MNVRAEERLHELLANRVRLFQEPTPICNLRRLGQELQSKVSLLVKRDDLMSFGFGGSKVRKLEILTEEARAAGANVLVAQGGLQSNCTRTTAQVAAMLGMECVIVANGRKPQRLTGNLLLCQLLGARVEYVKENKDRPLKVEAVLDELRVEGKKPFAIPLSAATPSTALSMTGAMLEVLDAIPGLDVVFVCSSSGATQAGLLLATLLRGGSTRVVGVSPDDPAAEVIGRVERILPSMAALLRLDLKAFPEIQVSDAFVGGAPLGRTQECDHVVELFARIEGFFVDPIYTSRPAAALLDALRGKRYPDAKSILLWHTGGLPGLFR